LLDKVRSILLKSEEAVFFALLTLASAAFMLELRSLYSTPIPDSYLWWGDESWLMLEFRTQILRGVFQHPYALGSSLAHGSGLLFGNMWIPALFYGVPAAFVPPAAMDIVLLGRTVTAILAFTVLVVVYEFIRRSTADRVLAIFGTLLLVTSRSFLFTSHSARYDILTALAIVIGLYLLLQRERPLTAKSAFILGLLIAATLLVTVHVTLALSISSILFILYRAESRKINVVGAYVGGVLVFLAVLIAITALRGQATLFGTYTSNAFALNVHDIPALRIYSRSVQTANFIQRWKAITTLEMGYVIACAFIALITILALLRKQSVRLGPKAVLILATLFAWFEFESSAPTSYLIYILPVMSLAIVAVFARFIPEYWRIPLVALGGLALFTFSLADMPGPHGRGYRLMTSNYQAVGAALNEIEQADSTKPLVLAFNPAVHEVLRDSNVRLMTTHFIEFPDTSMSVDSLLHKEGVRYVLIYRSSIKPDYMREVKPISDALHRIGTPLWERPGYFTDIGRSYFEANLGSPDTLQLYSIHD